eukprot:6197834-Pleurochrysis_carterae.AAC.7
MKAILEQPDWDPRYDGSDSESYDESLPPSDRDSPTLNAKRAQYHAEIDEAIQRKEVADGERIMRAPCRSAASSSPWPATQPLY